MRTVSVIILIVTVVIHSKFDLPMAALTFMVGVALGVFIAGELGREQQRLSHSYMVYKGHPR